MCGDHSAVDRTRKIWPFLLFPLFSFPFFRVFGRRSDGYVSLLGFRVALDFLPSYRGFLDPCRLPTPRLCLGGPWPDGQKSPSLSRAASFLETVSFFPPFTKFLMTFLPGQSPTEIWTKKRVAPITLFISPSIDFGGGLRRHSFPHQFTRRLSLLGWILIFVSVSV